MSALDGGGHRRHDKNVVSYIYVFYIRERLTANSANLAWHTVSVTR